jgi:hypothetical protein
MPGFVFRLRARDGAQSYNNRDYKEYGNIRFRLPGIVFAD